MLGLLHVGAISRPLRTGHEKLFFQHKSKSKGHKGMVSTERASLVEYICRI